MWGQLYTDNPKMKLLMSGQSAREIPLQATGHMMITCISLLSQRYANQK